MHKPRLAEHSSPGLWTYYSRALEARLAKIQNRANTTLELRSKGFHGTSSVFPMGRKTLTTCEKKKQKKNKKRKAHYTRLTTQGLPCKAHHTGRATQGSPARRAMHRNKTNASLDVRKRRETRHWTDGRILTDTAPWRNYFSKSFKTFQREMEQIQFTPRNRESLEFTILIFYFFLLFFFVQDWINHRRRSECVRRGRRRKQIDRPIYHIIEDKEWE